MKNTPTPFERTRKDVEVKGRGKEGSKREEAFDRMQEKAKAKPKAKK